MWWQDWSTTRHPLLVSALLMRLKRASTPAITLMHLDLSLVRCSNHHNQHRYACWGRVLYCFYNDLSAQ